jgi:hypothetical protein
LVTAGSAFLFGLDANRDGIVTSEEFNEAKVFTSGVLRGLLQKSHIGPNEIDLTPLPFEILPRAMLEVRKAFLNARPSAANPFPHLAPLEAGADIQPPPQSNKRLDVNLSTAVTYWDSDGTPDSKLKKALQTAPWGYLLGQTSHYQQGASVATLDSATGELKRLGSISIRGNHNYPTFSTRVGERFVIQGNEDPVLNVLDTRTNTLSQLPPPPTPVIFPVHAEVNGKLWLVGGYKYQNQEYPGGYAHNVIQQYDFAMGQWSVVGELPYDINSFRAHLARSGNRAVIVDHQPGRPNLLLVP